MNSALTLLRYAVGFAALAALSSGAAPIPGLFNTGVSNNGALLPAGSIDPHWRMIQSPDPAFPGPNAIVLNDTYPINPWLANGPNSKWIAPQTSEAVGNQPGDYIYRLTFDLTGLEPATAVISGRWTSDNAGPAVLLNGVATGVTGDGNFPALGNAFTINSGFIDGVNTLDFVVNNAAPGVNPTGFRAELSGTADLLPPPGTPPSITVQPVSASVGFLDPATFTVGATGSRPLGYQWRHGGTPIPGATNATLTIPAARDSDAGSYDVIVSNDSGSATSTPAALSVTFLGPAQLSYEPPGPATRRTGLVFSEIMYHPAANADGRRTEFIEIYNSNPFIEDISGWRLTGDADYTFPANTVLQGNNYLVVAPVPADVQAAYGISGVLGGFTNNLPNEGGVIRLRKKSGAIVLEVNYSDQSPWPAAADGTGHSLVLVRPSYGENNPKAWAASAFKGGSPGAADPVPAGPLENVVINEFLAHTDPPLADYVELFNNSGRAADLSGCWLSDDPATNKFRIADGTLLSPRGFISFEQTALGFALQANGETIYLLNSNATRVIDAVRYEGQANGVTSGRFPDGAPGFQPLAARTPGTTNAPPLRGEIVINEIMYNPISDDNDDEYVELHNPGLLPVNVGDWQFTAGIRYTFPPNTTIPAGGYLVVAANASRLATNYAGLNSANLVGNFNGNLSNGGERLALAKPDYSFTTNNGVITTNAFYIVVNEVAYGTGGRWGHWSDGGGSSLELIDPHSDNRLAANWADSDDTSKSVWTTVETTGVLETGTPTTLTPVSPTQGTNLQVMLLGAGEVLVDDVEVIVSGVNRVANSNFESGTTGWVFGGTHSKTTLGNTGYNNSSHSLYLRSSDRGDNTGNRLSTQVSPPIPLNTTATLRAKVRWLRGHPEILLRLKGNYLEAFGRLSVPANLGTPGAPNSVSAQNIGPVVSEVSHRPVLPQAGQPVRVTARVSDPDGVQSVTLRYRIDPASTTASLAMTDDGTGGDALAGDGIYSAQIPGQPSGKLIAFRIEASDAHSSPAISLFPADAPARECLVRVGETQPPGAFGTYRLWLTDATVATWSNREKTSNEDLDGTFVYGASRVVYNAGAHYSGSPYTLPTYNTPVGALCGYDINFPDDDAFLGTTHIVLDWPIRDDTDQREQLMFWLLDQYGLPNMYRRYVIMFVNGLRRGTIYDDVQQPGGDTIEEWFSDDSEGALFKPDCWDEFSDHGDRETGCIDLNALELYTGTNGVRKDARYRWTWKPRAIKGTVNDYTPMFNLINAANAATNGYQSAMESQADLEHWMRTFAMNDLASYWDAFGNPNAKNTYLYKPTKGTWKLMCWDMDVGLGVFNDPVNDPLFPTLNDAQMNRVYANPAWTRLYWCALAEGVKTFFNTGPGTAIDAILDAKYAAFQASGLTLNNPSSIKSWISQRRSFLLGQLNSVSNVFNVTSPSSFSTNRNFVTLTGTAPVNVHTITVNDVVYTPTWITANSWRLQLPVNAGTSDLVIAGLDRLGNVVSNITRTVTYTGTNELAEDNIIINEIMYSPLVSNATYIELFNRSATYSFDLSGWRLNGVDFTFPPGTVITNHGLLVVCKDRAAFGNAYGWGIPAFEGYGGQLDDGGETITLIKPGATPAQDLIVNRVTYDDDPPWPAGADGLGASLQVIDPDQDNNRVSNWGEYSGSQPSNGPTWRYVSYSASVGANPGNQLSLFLTNVASDVYLDDISFVQGSVAEAGINYIANGGFEAPLGPMWNVTGLATNSAIVSDVAHSGTGSLHLVFAAGAPALTHFYQVLTNVVPQGVTPGVTNTLSFWFLSGTNSQILQTRLNSLFRLVTDIRPPPPPPPVFPYTPGSTNNVAGTLPSYPLLWLSEVQPDNVGTITDNFGENDPWLEIYNGGANTLSLDGYFLANNYSNLAQWAFPPGAAINPGEYLLVWADGEPGETAGTNWHTNFRLNPTNGAVAISRTVNGAPQIVDYLNYREVGTNRSYGSFPPGQSSFRQVFYFPTPRGTNNPAAPPVTLFINEWMAANASFVRDPVDQDFDDWFEIYNPGTSRVDLAGFTLTDDFARPGKSVVPAGISVPPQGFLLVWADEESGQTHANGDLHVSFKLSQNAEQIALYDPAGHLIDSIVFGPQTDNVSQGRWPDGGPAPYYFMATPTPRGPNVISPANPPVLSITLESGNTVTLAWSAQAGRSYLVQHKDDLNAADWINLGSPVNATGPTALKVDQNNGRQRFYRVILVP